MKIIKIKMTNKIWKKKKNNNKLLLYNSEILKTKMWDLKYPLMQQLLQKQT